MTISGKHSWVETSDVLSMSPTLVWKIQLRAELHKQINVSARGLLQSLRQGLPELKPGEALAVGSCPARTRRTARTLRLHWQGRGERAAVPKHWRGRDPDHWLLVEPVCVRRRAPGAQPSQQLSERRVLREHLARRGHHQFSTIHEARPALSDHRPPRSPLPTPIRS